MAANTFVVRMFGKFHLERNGREIRGLEGCKAYDLLCYLLLNRQRQHPREALAALLWGNYTTAQSRKHLRQALWQLQSALGGPAERECEAGSGERDPDSGGHADRLLQIDAEWVGISHAADLWLDVSAFERAYVLTHDLPGEQIDGQALGLVQQAVALYDGDLLEGCYQDWCLFERERLQNSYLSMLDKLMSYSTQQGDYEAAIDCGETILRSNRARERTHREMMRLRYLAGDRTAALQQYGRCREILKAELGASPARSTVDMYEQILADELLVRGTARTPAAVPHKEILPHRAHRAHRAHHVCRAIPVAACPPKPSLWGLLDHVQHLCADLDRLQQQINDDLCAIRTELGDIDLLSPLPNSPTPQLPNYEDIRPSLDG